MKLRLFSLSVALLFAASALFTSCTQTDQPGTATGYHEGYQDISGLTVGQTYKFGISGGASGGHITGVSSYATGFVRVFYTRAAGDSAQITVTQNSTASDAITWAPATGSSKLRLYESAAPSSVGPSGLILGPTASTTSISGGSNADLVLQTNNNITFPFLTITTGKAMGINSRDADFGIPANAKIKGGLAMQQNSAALSSVISNNPPNFMDIDQNATLIFDSSSFVFVVHELSDNHWARVEVAPQEAVTTVNSNSGHYLWGDTGGANSYRFIDVYVTYDPTANQPYAANPVARKNALLAYTGLGLGALMH